MSVAAKSARGMAPLELLGVVAVAAGLAAVALPGLGWVPAIINFVLVLAGGVLYLLAPASRGGVLTGTLIVFAMALLVEFLLWETSFLNQLVADLLVSGMVWLLLVAVVVGLFAWLASVRDSVPFTAVTVILGVCGVGLLGYMAFVGPYEQNKLYLRQVTFASAEQAPEFKQRAALPVAHAQAQNSMTTIGDLQTSMSSYVPQQDRFTTLVTSKDVFKGYTEVVNQKVALTGQSSKENCAFSPAAQRRLGGWFDGNLTIWMAQKAGYGTVWEQDDAYGYCDNGTPMVVQPLLRTQGVWPMVLVPAGDAVYNGKTGELRILSGEEAAALPGPSISETWAHRLWQSTTARADWWSHQMGNVGYNDTSSDKADPNADNRSEFVLESAGGHAQYVSPLTKRGASSAIAGLSVVSATSGAEVPTMTIFEFDEAKGEMRQSNSAAVDRIKAAFGELSWASGLQVFEITPLTVRSWVASIGLRQNVVYRVLLSPDGSACLETATGDKIKCVSATQTSTGGTPVPDPSTTGGPQPTSVPVDSDLSKLTDAQLADLVQRINAEVEKRLRASGK